MEAWRVKGTDVPADARDDGLEPGCRPLWKWPRPDPAAIYKDAPDPGSGPPKPMDPASASKSLRAQCHSRSRAALAAAVSAACLFRVSAQDASQATSFLNDDPASALNLQGNGGIPYRPVSNTQLRRGPYNIRFGPVSALFSAATSVSYTDNALFTEQALGRADDIVVTPMFNTTLEWPVTDMNTLRIDVGVGYQKHLIQEQLDSLTVSPNSTIDWMVIAGNVRISLFNQTSTPASLSQRPELVTTGSAETAAFRRIQNTIGMSASWILSRDLSLQGGYSYTLERGLTGSKSFDVLNRDSHVASTALYRRLGPVWTVGTSASASTQAFQTDFQNSSTSYSGGLLAAWQPGRYFNVSSHVRYSVTQFDRNGRVADASNFNGITYDLSLSHRFRRYWEYTLAAGSGANTGFGNNFTEQFFANVILSWNVTERATFQLSGGYVNSTDSGSELSLPREAFRIPPESFDPTIPGMVDDGLGELYYFPPGSVDLGNGIVSLPLPGRVSENYTAGLTLSYRFSNNLSGSLGYTYGVRSSDLQLRNFNQNTVMLSLNYQF